MRINNRGRIARAFCALWLALSTLSTHALTPLADTEMSTVSGAGLAVALDNFQFAFAPTSYMEQVGVQPSNACGGGVTSNCWRRGDLRWFGINISGAGAGGSHWTEASCDASSLSCPRGGTISNFSPFDNPYLIRSWSPQGMAYDGSCINGAGTSCTGGTATKAIYEFLAPTAQPYYTLSFLGELEVGRTGSNANLTVGAGNVLKSQTIIRGNAAGSIYRAFQFTEPGNDTFAMFYHSYLRGDFRFSVAQASGSDSDTVGVPVAFDAEEGLHFRNVDAFIPFGQLYYQALTLGPVGTNGNFYIELPRVPNNPVVYGKFYGLQAGDTQGYETTRLALQGVSSDDYKLSHGYSRWGDWYPGSSGTRNAYNATDDGIFFRACSTCTSFNAFAKRPTRIDVRGETFSMQRTQNYGGGISSGPGNGAVINTRVANLGDARIEGILINHFRMTSCTGGVC